MSITYNYGWLRLLSFHLIGMWHTFQSTFDKTNYKPDILERYAQTDSCLTHLTTSCITIMYNSSFIHYAQTSMLPHRDYILYTVKSQLKSSCLHLNSLTSCGCCWCASQSSHVQQLAHDLSLSLSLSHSRHWSTPERTTRQRLDELIKLVAWWLRAMRECCHRLPHRLLSAPTTSAGQISWQVAWTPVIHCIRHLLWAMQGIYTSEHLTNHFDRNQSCSSEETDSVSYNIKYHKWKQTICTFERPVYRSCSASALFCSSSCLMRYSRPVSVFNDDTSPGTMHTANIIYTSSSSVKVQGQTRVSIAFFIYLIAMW